MACLRPETTHTERGLPSIHTDHVQVGAKLKSFHGFLSFDTRTSRSWFSGAASN